MDLHNLIPCKQSCIEYNGILYKCLEEDTLFSTDELWFIAKTQNFTKFPKQFAKIWSSKKTLNCKYSPEVENEINKLEKFIYS